MSFWAASMEWTPSILYFNHLIAPSKFALIHVKERILISNAVASVVGAWSKSLKENNF
jgi:hypothetical protein